MRTSSLIPPYSGSDSMAVGDEEPEEGGGKGRWNRRMDKVLDEGGI